MKKITKVVDNKKKTPKLKIEKVGLKVGVRAAIHDSDRV